MQLQVTYAYRISLLELEKFTADKWAARIVEHMSSFFTIMSRLSTKTRHTVVSSNRCSLTYCLNVADAFYSLLKNECSLLTGVFFQRGPQPSQVEGPWYSLCCAEPTATKISFSENCFLFYWSCMCQCQMTVTIIRTANSDSLSVYSIVYIDHSAEVAEARAVFKRRDIRHSVNVKDWVRSRQFEIYPGRYVRSLLVVRCK